VTTVAFDGTTLAVDRQATYGSTKFVVRKLVRCGEYMLAASGRSNAIQEWLADGADPADRPLSEEPFGAIAIRIKTGRAYLLNGKRPYLEPIRAKTLAMGSGSEFATAALDFGKTAVEAIRYASKRDVNTGLGVDSYAVKRRK
jgi:hypothetical protein